MMTIRRLLAALTTAAGLLLSPFGAHAAVTQLGFILDGSGSVSTTNYNLLRTGLSAAIASLPVDGTVEITIVSYGSSSSTVTAPVILSAANLATIQGQITSHVKDNGGTDTAGAITATRNLMTGSAVFADPTTKSIINLATDGFPNSQVAAVAAGAAALAAGIDALSIEAIGSGVSSAGALANLAAIAYPGPVSILAVNSTNIPNPLNGSFVVPVSDFSALAPVLLAKVQASITPVPEPASLLLVGTSLLGALLASKRTRRKAAVAPRLQFA